VGITQAAAQHQIGAGVIGSFDRKTNTPPLSSTRTAPRTPHRVADVGEHVGGGDQVVAPLGATHVVRNVLLRELFVDALRTRTRQHVGRQIHAIDALGEGLTACARASAATEIERASEMPLAHGLPQFGHSTLRGRGNAARPPDASRSCSA
jgi:hypothetical protein